MLRDVGFEVALAQLVPLGLGREGHWQLVLCQFHTRVSLAHRIFKLLVTWTRLEHLVTLLLSLCLRASLPQEALFVVDVAGMHIEIVVYLLYGNGNRELLTLDPVQ